MDPIAAATIHAREAWRRRVRRSATASGPCTARDRHPLLQLCRVITEGEAWTREQLDRLRAARFRPAAVASFLIASQRRANQVRSARPEVARREATWAAAGAAAWLGLAAAQIEPFRGRVGHGLTGWAATMLMVDWHLGMLETEDGEPRNLGPADAATLMRAWLVPAVAERPTPAALRARLRDRHAGRTAGPSRPAHAPRP